MNLLRIENLSVSYAEKKVVKNCSFTVNKGEIIVVLGASGDGKTTLLKTITGLLPRFSGNVFFEDLKVPDPTEILVPGHPKIKLVNQDFCLDEYHTVEENIRLRLLQFDYEYQAQRIKTLLRMTTLTTYRTKKATELSGGQRQRLAIARALADEPELLLLDEPFNQLDFQTKNNVVSHIKRYLVKENISVVMVTHNGIEAMEWADRILFMKKGKIIRKDTPDNFYNNPNPFRTDIHSDTYRKVKMAHRQLLVNAQAYNFLPSIIPLRSPILFAKSEFLFLFQQSFLCSL